MYNFIYKQLVDNSNIDHLCEQYDIQQEGKDEKVAALAVLIRVDLFDRIENIELKDRVKVIEDCRQALEMLTSDSDPESLASEMVKTIREDLNKRLNEIEQDFIFKKIEDNPDIDSLCERYAINQDKEEDKIAALAVLVWNDLYDQIEAYPLEDQSKLLNECDAVIAKLTNTSIFAPETLAKETVLFVRKDLKKRLQQVKGEIKGIPGIVREFHQVTLNTDKYTSPPGTWLDKGGKDIDVLEELTDHLGQFKPQDPTIENIKEELKQAKEFVGDINDIKLHGTPTSGFVTRIQQAITEQEHVCLPGGYHCTKKGEAGHAVAYHIEKQKDGNYSFTLIDTGQGLSDTSMHPKTGGIISPRYYDFKVKDLPLDVLSDANFLTPLVEFLTKGLDKASMKPIHTHLKGKLIQEGGGKQVKNPSETDSLLARKPQNKNNCVYKSYIGYIKSRMAEENTLFHQFKLSITSLLLNRVSRILEGLDAPLPPPATSEAMAQSGNQRIRATGSKDITKKDVQKMVDKVNKYVLPKRQKKAKNLTRPS